MQIFKNNLDVNHRRLLISYAPDWSVVWALALLACEMLIFRQDNLNYFAVRAMAANRLQRTDSDFPSCRGVFYALESVPGYKRQFSLEDKT